MLMLPASRRSHSERRLETFTRARILATGAPVTRAWALDARGKKISPEGGTYGIGLGSTTHHYPPRRGRLAALCHSLLGRGLEGPQVAGLDALTGCYR